jgi:hypothetical protein
MVINISVMLINMLTSMVFTFVYIFSSSKTSHENNCIFTGLIT